MAVDWGEIGADLCGYYKWPWSAPWRLTWPQFEAAVEGMVRSMRRECQMQAAMVGVDVAGGAGGPGVADPGPAAGPAKPRTGTGDDHITAAKERLKARTGRTTFGLHELLAEARQWQSAGK